MDNNDAVFNVQELPFEDDILPDSSYIEEPVDDLRTEDLFRRAEMLDHVAVDAEDPVGDLLGKVDLVKG